MELALKKLSCVNLDALKVALGFETVLAGSKYVRIHQLTALIMMKKEVTVAEVKKDTHEAGADASCSEGGGGCGGDGEGAGGDADRDGSGGGDDREEEGPDSPVAGGDSEGSESEVDSYKITVKRIDQNRSFELDVYDSDTITMVKAQIQGKEGIPPRHQRLVYAGKQLQDFDSYDTLGYYNIPKVGATIHMHIRGRGGGKRGLASVISSEDKLEGWIRKVGFVERKLQPNEVESLIDAMNTCCVVLDEFRNPNESQFIVKRLAELDIETLDSILETSFKGEQGMKKLLKMLWNDVAALEAGAVKTVSVLFQELVARFLSSYAKHYNDCDRFTDYAVMDHTRFVSDVKTAITQHRQRDEVEQGKHVQHMAQQMAQQMAQKMAEEMLAAHLARQPPAADVVMA